MEIIFVLAVVITSISFILSIVSGIVLVKLSSKLIAIEKEIDKKVAEFDSIRKEMTRSQKVLENESVILENYRSVSHESIPISLGEPPPGLRPEDTIKIVRNIHGNFEEYDSISQKEENKKYSHNRREEDRLSTEAPLKEKTTSTRDFSVHIKKNLTKETEISKTETFKPVNDIFTINLYSELTKDADFHRMWKELSEILKTNVAPNIVINLGGIHFLYEKEMEYLEKINDVVKSSGGSLSFVNCDRDLFDLFNRHPQLLTLIKKI